MRKTRLVILPGARSRTHTFALLLFLACPNIAFQGRDRQDIQPSCSFSTSNLKWLEKKPDTAYETDGFGQAGWRIGHGLKTASTWNMVNMIPHLGSSNQNSSDFAQCRSNEVEQTSVKTLSKETKGHEVPSEPRRTLTYAARRIEDVRSRRINTHSRRLDLQRTTDSTESRRIVDQRERRIQDVRTNKQARLIDTDGESRMTRVGDSNSRSVSMTRRSRVAHDSNMNNIRRDERSVRTNSEMVRSVRREQEPSRERTTGLRDIRRDNFLSLERDSKRLREIPRQTIERRTYRSDTFEQNIGRTSESRERRANSLVDRRDTRRINEKSLFRDTRSNDNLNRIKRAIDTIRTTRDSLERREITSLPFRTMETARFDSRQSRYINRDSRVIHSEPKNEVHATRSSRSMDSGIDLSQDTARSSNLRDIRQSREVRRNTERQDTRRSVSTENRRVSVTEEQNRSSTRRNIVLEQRERQTNDVNSREQPRIQNSRLARDRVSIQRQFQRRIELNRRLSETENRDDRIVKREFKRNNNVRYEVATREEVRNGNRRTNSFRNDYRIRYINRVERDNNLALRRSSEQISQRRIDTARNQNREFLNKNTIPSDSRRDSRSSSRNAESETNARSFDYRQDNTILTRNIRSANLNKELSSEIRNRNLNRITYRDDIRFLDTRRDSRTDSRRIGSFHNDLDLRNLSTRMSRRQTTENEETNIRSSQDNTRLSPRDSRISSRNIRSMIRNNERLSQTRNVDSRTRVSYRDDMRLSENRRDFRNDFRDDSFLNLRLFSARMDRRQNDLSERRNTRSLSRENTESRWEMRLITQNARFYREDSKSSLSRKQIDEEQTQRLVKESGKVFDSRRESRIDTRNARKSNDENLITARLSTERRMNRDSRDTVGDQRIFNFDSMRRLDSRRNTAILIRRVRSVIDNTANYRRESEHILERRDALSTYRNGMDRLDFQLEARTDSRNTRFIRDGSSFRRQAMRTNERRIQIDFRDDMRLTNLRHNLRTDSRNNRRLMTDSRSMHTASNDPSTIHSRILFEQFSQKTREGRTQDISERSLSRALDVLRLKTPSNLRNENSREMRSSDDTRNKNRARSYTRYTNVFTNDNSRRENRESFRDISGKRNTRMPNLQQPRRLSLGSSRLSDSIPKDFNLKERRATSNDRSKVAERINTISVRSLNKREEAFNIRRIDRRLEVENVRRSTRSETLVGRNTSSRRALVSKRIDDNRNELSTRRTDSASRVRLSSDDSASRRDLRNIRFISEANQARFVRSKRNVEIATSGMERAAKREFRTDTRLIRQIDTRRMDETRHDLLLDGFISKTSKSNVMGTLEILGSLALVALAIAATESKIPLTEKYGLKDFGNRVGSGILGAVNKIRQAVTC